MWSFNSPSRTFSRSACLSSVSVRSSARRSARSRSSRRRDSSFSQASLRRNPSSRPASSPAFLIFSASSRARYKIREASPCAPCFSSACRARSRAAETASAPSVPRTTPTAVASRTGGVIRYTLQNRLSRQSRLIYRPRSRTTLVTNNAV